MTQPVTGEPVAHFPRQAIVVIHGMGEQKPMDTITGFAQATWGSDPAVHVNQMPNPGEVWSKPDTRTGSLELRRLTTRPSTPNATYPRGARQDFFELYWADLSGGSTWDQVKNWIWMLLFRNPVTNVPPRVRLAWLLLWLVTLVIIVLVIAAALPEKKPECWPEPWAVFCFWTYPPFTSLATWPTWLLGAIVAGLGWGAHQLVVPYFGRVVRYTRAIPDNVAARKSIRERGLKLLDDLHRDQYERIIVVGHSLGSLLAYDLVAYFWADRLAAHTVKEGSQAFRHLCVLESVVAELETVAGDAARQGLLEQYDEARRLLCNELRRRPPPAKDQPDTRWLITDLVTVGSPLGHADFLLAKNGEDRLARIATREFATCPPLREALDPPVRSEAERAGLPVDPDKPALFCFPLMHDDEWQLHHAAQFAVVRWTNIHDPAELVFFGDLISSPAAPVFGPAVRDVDLRASPGRQSWRFTHTRYWRDGTPTPRALTELRAALDLAGRGNP